MKVYFDTEFTGLHKGTTLISIGLISEDGDEFYAEFNDFDESQVNDWIKENVLDHLVMNGEPIDDKSIYHIGTKEEIKNDLTQWLWLFESVELVSDVCHYDMVMFCDIFGGAFDIPNHVSACCHDINQDIARYFGISELQAFDKSREELVKQFGRSVIGEKHNSLYDAKVIREIYQSINTPPIRNVHQKRPETDIIKKNYFKELIKKK